MGKYLAADPDNLTLLRDYAGQAWVSREYEACAMALQKLLHLVGPTAEGQAELVRAWTAANRIDHAIGVAAQSLVQWPDSVDLRVALANAYLAARDFEQVLASLPTEDPLLRKAARACALRIRALHHLGRLDEAASEAAAFEADETHAEVSAAVIPVLTDLSRIDEATARAAELAQESGERAPPYEVCEPLAITAIDGGQDATARQWIDYALNTRRDDGRIWLLDGMTHLQAGQWDQAAKSLAQAVHLMPSHAGSHLAQGWMHLMREDPGTARQCFERAVEASPSFAEGYGSLAVAAVREGRNADAEPLIRKALLLDKHSASARYAQALQRGMPPQRISELAQAVIAHARSMRVPARRQ